MSIAAPNLAAEGSLLAPTLLQTLSQSPHLASESTLHQQTNAQVLQNVQAGLIVNPSQVQVAPRSNLQNSVDYLVHQLNGQNSNPVLANESLKIKKAVFGHKDEGISSRLLDKAGMQREFSAFSIISKQSHDTADNSNSNLQSKSAIMAPAFKFGLQRRSLPFEPSARSNQMQTNL
jgi:hypothetical protein